MTVQVRQEMRASGVGLVARRRGAPFISVLRERDPGTCEVSPWLLLLKGPTPCPGRALLSFCLGPNGSLVVVQLRSLDADQGRGEPCSTLEPVSHSAVTDECRRRTRVGVSEVSAQFLWEDGDTG